MICLNKLINITLAVKDTLCVENSENEKLTHETMNRLLSLNSLRSEGKQLVLRLRPKGFIEFDISIVIDGDSASDVGIGQCWRNRLLVTGIQEIICYGQFNPIPSLALSAEPCVYEPLTFLQ